MQLYRGSELIRKGTKLGVITGVFGEVLQEVFSPVDGFVIYLSATPPINKGETLFGNSSSDDLNSGVINNEHSVKGSS